MRYHRNRYPVYGPPDRYGPCTEYDIILQDGFSMAWRSVGRKSNGEDGGTGRGAVGKTGSR